MKYQLRCLKCGKAYPEDEYITRCENGCDALLRTEYKQKRIEINPQFPGLWKYIDWLPIKSVDPHLLRYSSDFSIQKGGRFAEYLGLKNLVICFNLYNPKQQQTMQTGTFKDIEAELSFQRLFDSKDMGRTFIVSSDGNIATAFNYYAKVLQYPVLLSVTMDAVQKRIWSFWEKNEYLKVLALSERFDYSDAISLAGNIGKNSEFLLEGGTRNVARRDGIGTIMLDVALKLGRMPDHYFQALGSGPGAIAMYEASLRLQNDGRFGKDLPRIHGSQNMPFVPMYDAWQKNSREIDGKYQEESAKELIKQVYAHVLTNRFPHYADNGGVFEVLTETNGEFYGITNDEAIMAKKLFFEKQGINIAPPAAVAVASLMEAVKTGKVDKDDVILLNITGGQRDIIDDSIYKLTDYISVDDMNDIEYIIDEVKKWKEKLQIKNI